MFDTIENQIKRAEHAINDLYVIDILEKFAKKYGLYINVD
jgi:hypothetical protein